MKSRSHLDETMFIEVFDALLFFACATFFTGLFYLYLYVNEQRMIFKDQYTPKDFGTAPVFYKEYEEPFEPIYNEYLDGYYELWSQWNNLDIGYIDIQTEYIGRYFITAYCPEECGWSWSTSSGATCHYSDKWYVPTTCAIDRNYHKYGEYLMIGGNGKDGRIYITEDTGPGVKGHWIDTFVETMDEVRSFNTRYDNVYSVQFIQKKAYAKDLNLLRNYRRMILHDIYRKSL